jgi:hypothetical protein
MFMTDAPVTSITINFTRAEKSKNWPIPEERKALRLVKFLDGSGDRHRRDLGDIPSLAGNGGDALGVLTEADSIL